MLSRSTMLAALALVAAATGAGVSSGATSARGTTRACASADCVPDLVSVDVRSRGSRLVLEKSGGRGGSVVDLSPNRKRVLIDQGLQLVTATLSGHAIARVADGLGTIGTARWSPDGKLIAFVARGGGTCGSAAQLWVVQAGGDGLRKLSDCANYPAWAPDSKHVVFIGNFNESFSGTVSVVDVDGSERRDLAGWSDTSAPTLAWASRGGRVAFTAGPGAGDVRIVQTSGAAGVVTIRHANQPAWSPDGRRLAIVRIQRPYDRYALQLVRPDGSSVQRVDRGAGISYPAWSHDGRLAYLKAPIAARGERRRLGVYEARPGTSPRPLTKEPSDTAYFGLFWSARGDRVLYLRCRT